MIRCLSIALVLVLCIAVRADVESGPKVGEKIEAFKVFGVVGSVEGKEVDFTAERKDEPTIYVFVQHEHWTRPMARFLKKLDTDAKEANDKIKVVAVWLGEKPDLLKDYLPKAQMSLNLANTDLSVFTGDKSGPNNWGINIDAHITIVLAEKAKVKANLALQSVNDTDVKKVIEAIKK